MAVGHATRTLREQLSAVSFTSLTLWCVTGILVEWASWWNGHLARFIPGQTVSTLATNKIRVSRSLTHPTAHLLKYHQSSEKS
ncbi:MAG: hypothetical protein F6K65_10075 [Moorea sp. SIO3C2]|nr:hypothetical protein [Moorena sp. SIO3C2]